MFTPLSYNFQCSSLYFILCRSRIPPTIIPTSLEKNAFFRISCSADLMTINYFSWHLWKNTFLNFILRIFMWIQNSGLTLVFSFFPHLNDGIQTSWLPLFLTRSSHSYLHLRYLSALAALKIFFLSLLSRFWPVAWGMNFFVFNIA